MTAYAERDRKLLEQQGFVLIPGVATMLVDDLGRAADAAMAAMANALGVSERDYLLAVSTWGIRSEIVQRLLSGTVQKLRPLITALAPVNGAPVDATVFLKSTLTSAGTHAHQDIAYRWNQPNRYTCTTWLALDDTDSSTGALSFLPGSHLDEIQVRQDFLAADFVDRRETDEWRRRAVTVAPKAGDAIVFDARTWHAAHPFSGSGVRRALAVRWRNALSADAWVIPEPSVDPGVFGMDTSGRLLVSAIAKLLPDLGAVREVTVAIDALLARRSWFAGPLTPDIREVLERLRLGLRAEEHHQGRPYAPRAWALVRDVVLPALRAAANATTRGGVA